MGLFDEVGGILQQYSGGQAAPSPNDVNSHYDQVSAAVPQESLAAGLSEAFRSQNTPPFGQMMGHLFSHASPQQRSGILTMLLSAAGPSALAALAGKGGGLAGLVQSFEGGGITPAHSDQISPGAVQELANHAEKQDPSIVDKMGGFFSQHSSLVKSLDSGTLGTILSKVAQKAA